MRMTICYLVMEWNREEEGDYLYTSAYKLYIQFMISNVFESNRLLLVISSENKGVKCFRGSLKMMLQNKRQIGLCQILIFLYSNVISVVSAKMYKLSQKFRNFVIYQIQSLNLGNII